jgi:hypothetical protein
VKFYDIEHPELGLAGRVPETALPHLAEGWTVLGDAPSPVAVPEPFDPAGHTVAEVNDYLDYAVPEERDRVLAAERDGKNRAGIVGA